LLGTPLLEIRFTQPLDGLLPVFEELVQVEQVGPNWVHYRTADPQVTNPRLINSLVNAGASILTLSELPRSLEEVYLRIVSE